MSGIYDLRVAEEWAEVAASLYAIQDDARKARRGLWADPNAVPPSKWRRSGSR